MNESTMSIRVSEKSIVPAS